MRGVAVVSVHTLGCHTGVFVCRTCKRRTSEVKNEQEAVGMKRASKAGRADLNISASPVLVLVRREYAAGKAQLTSSRSFSAF